ncbi:ComF family protein [Dokdonia sp. Hel_I_53]|uniref:ComF family protein n=1 Tax=Dokdonia sp. Hel_I_53 TaxID=1566287 RepID=UPI001199282E|nr:phosphoribosyltransferase family protein [Dokdonia sp. Hel_I_53]TVZ52456.1 ComF family protein [Dokdonia sp. Hel_I_53]
MLQSLRSLFFSKTCNCCDLDLYGTEKCICTACRLELPLTNFHTYNDSAIKKVFYGRINLQNATSLFYFEKKGPVQKLMHNLKYKGHHEISSVLGNWLGVELAKIDGYMDIDVVIPVPIHPKKKRVRGYNQVTGFGRQIAHHLNAIYRDDILLKSKNTKTQVFKGRFKRSDEVLDAFMISPYSNLEGKHILLCDDILTTGATLESCALQLLKIPNITLSIAVMAIAQ